MLGSLYQNLELLGLLWWLNGKESACNAEGLGLIPGSGRSPGEGNGYLLQYSGLENSTHATWDMEKYCQISPGGISSPN